MSACVGSCNVIKSSLWYRENGVVTARKAWSVCLYTSLTLGDTNHKDYDPTTPLCSQDTPSSQSHPEFTMFLMFSALHLISSSFSTFFVLIVAWFLPHMPPACGNASHSKQSTTENRTQEAKEAGQW